MSIAENASPVRQIDLWDSLDGEWIKLVLPVVRDVGAASQTLGGILRETNRETFVFRDTIARNARLSKRTLEKHLLTLAERGWIVNKGRQRTRGGTLRRSATIQVTAQTKATLNDFAILPWWATCYSRTHGRLPWSSRILLAFIMSRLAAIKRITEDNESNEYWGDEWGEVIDEYGEGRFRFSLQTLGHRVGLSKNSLIAAKRHLFHIGIVDWGGSQDGQTADRLIPNPSFNVVITDAGNGQCWIDFVGDR